MPKRRSNDRNHLQTQRGAPRAPHAKVRVTVLTYPELWDRVRAEAERWDIPIHLFVDHALAHAWQQVATQPGWSGRLPVPLIEVDEEDPRLRAHSWRIPRWLWAEMRWWAANLGVTVRSLVTTLLKHYTEDPPPDFHPTRQSPRKPENPHTA